MSGRLPVQGDTLTMLRAGASLTVGRQLNQGAQGVVYEATVGETLLALKWLRAGPRSAAMQKAIEVLTERPRPHKAFIWPIDIVTSGQNVDPAHYVVRPHRRQVAPDQGRTFVGKIIPDIRTAAFLAERKTGIELQNNSTGLRGPFRQPI